MMLGRFKAVSYFITGREKEVSGIFPILRLNLTRNVPPGPGNCRKNMAPQAPWNSPPERIENSGGGLYKAFPEAVPAPL
jgi:hypothetical protein